MKDSATIHAWLQSDRDYLTGLHLFSIYGSLGNLARLLSKKRMPEKLLYEMEKLAKKYPLTGATVITMPAKLPAEKPTKEKVKPNDPQEVQDLKAKAQLLMDERRMLHSTKLDKRMFATDRSAAAFRILAIGEELDILYSKIEHFNSHGALPAAPVVAPITDPMQLATKIQNLQNYIRRYEGKPGKSHLLDKYKLELEAINKQLAK